jgi:DNA-directed RNA polymerase subunit RPC12/RpoP
MTIRYNCEKCGQLLKIKDELAGQPNKCPTCKTKFIVPQPSGAADSSPSLGSKTNLIEAALAEEASSSSTKLTPPKAAPAPPSRPAPPPVPKTLTQADLIAAALAEEEEAAAPKRTAPPKAAAPKSSPSAETKPASTQADLIAAALAEEEEASPPPKRPPARPPAPPAPKTSSAQDDLIAAALAEEEEAATGAKRTPPKTAPPPAAKAPPPAEPKPSSAQEDLIAAALAEEEEASAKPRPARPAPAPDAKPQPKSNDDFDPADVLGGGPSATSSPPPKAKPDEDFDAAAFLSEGGPKKKAPGASDSAIQKGRPPAAAPAGHKDGDFDAADFLMEGKPKKAPAPPAPEKKAPAGPKTPAGEVPVAAPAPTGDKLAEDFDAADFLIAGGPVKAAAPAVPVPAPGQSPAPAGPRRWGTKAEPAAPVVPTDMGGVVTASAATQQMARGGEEEEREPIDYVAMVKDVGAVRFTIIALIWLASGGIYWWLSQPRLEVPPRGYVSGRVTLDGQPLAGAIVSFTPDKREYKTNPKAPKGLGVRTATAVTDADGRYSLHYIDYYKGAFIGKNYVYIAPMLDEKGRDRIPADWAMATVDHPVDVLEGKNPDFNIEMKSKGGR